MLEKKLEANLRQRIRKLKGLALKFVSPGKAGVPDRIILMPKGKIYFVEMKRPGGKLRPIQKKVITDLRKLGFRVFVIDSKEKIEAFTKLVESEQEDGV